MSFWHKFLTIFGLIAHNPLSELDVHSKSWYNNYQGIIPYALTENHIYLIIRQDHSFDANKTQVSCALMQKVHSIDDDVTNLKDKICQLDLKVQGQLLLMPLQLGLSPNHERVLVPWLSHDLNIIRNDDITELDLRISIVDMANNCTSNRVIGVAAQFPASEVFYDRIGSHFRIVVYNESFDIFYRNDETCGQLKVCRNTYDFGGRLLAKESLVFDLSSVTIVPNSVKDFYYLWSARDEFVSVAKRSGGTETNALRLGKFFENSASILYEGFSGAENLFGICYASNGKDGRCLQVDEDLSPLSNYVLKDLKTREKILRVLNLNRGRMMVASVSCPSGIYFKCTLELTIIEEGKNVASSKSKFDYLKECRNYNMNYDIKIYRVAKDVARMVICCFDRKNTKQIVRITVKEIRLMEN